MKKCKYIKKLRDKKKLSQTKFKNITININESSLKLKTYVMSFGEFKEYIEGLIYIDNYTSYLIKKTFILKLSNAKNNFDILVLNNNLEITQLIRGYNKANDEIFFQNPVSLLIMAENSINFHKIAINQKIKLSKFTY